VVGDAQRLIRLDLANETGAHEPGQHAQRRTAAQAPDREGRRDSRTAGTTKCRAGAGACQDERGVVEPKIALLGAREAPLREGRSGPGDEHKTGDTKDDPETPQEANIAAGMSKAFVGIGSNLGDREAHVKSALELLAAEQGIDVVAVSELRETNPVGPVEQGRFVNGAALLETELSPRELLGRLLTIEGRLGRVRNERFGPRTIDLDLLVYGDAVVDEPGLTVPHPRLHERRFALEPLADLAPDLVVPGRGPISALLAKLE
jgi:2-amino-4-hydroxy-6-hydroxymethyldihydropteridine diphosphokinase